MPFSTARPELVEGREFSANILRQAQDERKGTEMDMLERLQQTIAQRRAADPASSYVAQLHARGLPVIARKLGEEAVEAVIAALTGSTQELTAEAADLLFHLLVLLDARGVPLQDVLAELKRRAGTSGIEEKTGRSR